MQLSNEAVREHQWLKGMYADSYYPDFLVDKIKAILLDLCEQIEREQPKTDEALLVLTHAATEQINALAEEFGDNESDLETVARECMAEEFVFIVNAYGFHQVDIEDVIAPREW